MREKAKIVSDRFSTVVRPHQLRALYLRERVKLKVVNSVKMGPDNKVKA